MAVRIMTYVGLLYQDLIQSQNLRYENKLPPVLPIVLYNGDPEWTAATNIKQLIQEIPGGSGQVSTKPSNAIHWIPTFVGMTGGGWFVCLSACGSSTKGQP